MRRAFGFAGGLAVGAIAGLILGYIGGTIVESVNTRIDLYSDWTSDRYLDHEGMRRKVCEPSLWD
ncbi:hypothetical protein [Mesobacterium pallidum]|uniref:hypothetical protein n=1 Tax=Mesobacterium pallidum TaxID=2872037 RepID=UPI001EE35D6F|nr:hypothetical protein [Mesobacterium pallidum]